ncbi:hypothetical protein [Paenibacillus naphthalenovorans]|uniref:hypothetical protein n=1 Tax=Paenibacillus naphthalenovorans TaxID=162209 RepID=UPI003D2D32FE
MVSSLNLLEYKVRVVLLFSQIFNELARHLRDTEHIWSGGGGLLEAEDMLEQAIRAARPAYFYMRERQLEAIRRRVQLVARVYQMLPHGELPAGVFEELAEDVKMLRCTGRAENRLAELEKQFKSMPLPSTREEFEIRAELLQITEERKVYFSVAKREKRPVGQDA